MCQLLTKCQQKFESGLRKAFELWASFVIRSGVCSPVITMIMLYYISSGMALKDEIGGSDAWAPKGNESIAAVDRGRGFLI